MLRSALVSSCAFLAFVPVAHAATITEANTPAAACGASFTSEGGWRKGSTFRAQLAVASTTAADASKRMAQQLLADGWASPKIESELGAVTANMQGNPFTVMVKDAADGGVMLEAIQRVGADTMVQKNSVKDAMCRVLVAAVDAGAAHGTR